MSLHDDVNALNSMILQGQIMEAFEKYYADDITMQENNGEPRVGKATNRAYEEAFVSSLTAFKGAKVNALAVNEEEGTTMVQWWMAFTHKEYGDIERHQVCVQQWKDGQIVHERFFYGQ